MSVPEDLLPVEFPLSCSISQWKTRADGTLSAASQLLEQPRLTERLLKSTGTDTTLKKICAKISNVAVEIKSSVVKRWRSELANA